MLNNHDTNESEDLQLLFDIGCNELVMTLDLQNALEISDRINQNKQDCKLSVVILINMLSQTMNNKLVLNAVNMLEFLTKNCNLRFHHEISNPVFMKTMMRLLKRVRKKHNILEKMYYTSKNWEVIEYKILYMIQLWADTFMMHHKDFKDIMQVYQQLRKEGVKFPIREKNQKYMLQMKGIQESPVFNADSIIHQGKENQLQKPKELRELENEKYITSMSKEECIKRQQQTCLSTNYYQNKESKLDEYIDNNDYDDNDDDIDDDDDDQDDAQDNFYFQQQMLGINEITQSEIKVIQSQVELLNEVVDNAEVKLDLLSDFAIEIKDYLEIIRKRLKFISQIPNINFNTECQILIASINQAINAYKQKLKCSQQTFQSNINKNEKYLKEIQKLQKAQLLLDITLQQQELELNNQTKLEKNTATFDNLIDFNDDQQEIKQQVVKIIDNQQQQIEEDAFEQFKESVLIQKQEFKETFDQFQKSDEKLQEQQNEEDFDDFFAQIANRQK